MGGQSNTQQPVFYDADMGQYYTQTPQNQSPFAGLFGNKLPQDAYSNPMISALFGKGGQRNYLNNFGQSNQAMQAQAPYEYADTSLAALFPLLQGAMQGSQGNVMDGLLGSQGATSQASSGAGRFLK